jgi:hypothetical protein
MKIRIPLSFSLLDMQFHNGRSIFIISISGMEWEDRVISLVYATLAVLRKAKEISSAVVR